MRPSQNRYHAIIVEKAEIFGPTMDALVRDLHARIGPGEAEKFRELIETWPFEQDNPLNPDALYHRLLALRGQAGQPHAAPGAEGSRGGSWGRGLLGMALGGLLGLPLGICIYFLVDQFLLPASLRSSEGVMWTVIALGVLPAILLGGFQGIMPSRLGGALQAGLGGFVVAGVVSAVASVFLASALGEIFGMSQMEGAFAMGVVFTIMPLAALVGGLLFGFYSGRRAWRKWSTLA
ncbi:hypothetical protein [Sediminicoccus sp. KRV36]|uniref:hypothetical protein n=1 Tax=Sediminicoccus sp. KRV36 TaxID=3133721 RepID=UPI002010C1B3|nr:hypothetical protein [Sediminicoccus rosea]UPY36835.1 hypothetical protein LHU95_21885 [Sediminicoccus rosea]